MRKLPKIDMKYAIDVAKRWRDHQEMETTGMPSQDAWTLICATIPNQRARLNAENWRIYEVFEALTNLADQKRLYQ